MDKSGHLCRSLLKIGAGYVMQQGYLLFVESKGGQFQVLYNVTSATLPIVREAASGLDKNREKGPTRVRSKFDINRSPKSLLNHPGFPYTAVHLNVSSVFTSFENGAHRLQFYRHIISTYAIVLAQTNEFSVCCVAASVGTDCHHL